MQLRDARPRYALDQNLDGAVGQLQQLQNGCHRAETVQILELRIVDVSLLLRHQHDALVGLHGRVEGVNRFLAPNEQRDDHVRIYHDVAQWQHRHAVAGGRGGFGFGCFSHVGSHMDGPRSGSTLNDWGAAPDFNGATPPESITIRSRVDDQACPEPPARRGSSTAASRASSLR
jgi:hypothetical protein